MRKKSFFLKNLFAWCFCLFMVGSLRAEDVPISSIRIAAINAFSYYSGVSSSELILKEIIPMTQNDTLVMYVCNFDDGFVLLSADFSVNPVLGFSDEKMFDVNNVPPALDFILQNYKNEIIQVKRSQVNSDTDMRDEWNNLINGNKDKSFYAPTSYLIHTRWNQEGGTLPHSDISFNYFCPKHASGNGDSCLTYAGCGAVALAQILHYWSCDVYPHGTLHNIYENIYINLSDQTYDWFYMRQDKADVYNAKLIADCAIALNTEFSCSIEGSSSYANILYNRLVYNYGFANVSLVFHTDETEWNQALQSSISQRSPIICFGNNNATNPNLLSSHFWVIDGYYNNNCYHCNFGWGGSGDGWYYLTCVDPLSHNFSYNQCAFTNIYPTTYTNVEFINSTMSTGTFTGHKIIIENSSVNSGANIILDANCSTEIFGPFTVPAGSCLEIR